MAVQRPEAQADTWCGELRLVFERQGQATRLIASRAQIPLAIQRPFYPEGPELCHVVLLHPPGGMVGGDQLDIALE